MAQDRRRVEVWSRLKEGFRHEVHERGAAATLASIDFRLDIDELYDVAGVATG